MNIVKCMRIATYALALTAGMFMGTYAFAASISYIVDGESVTEVTAGTSSTIEFTIENDESGEISDFTIFISDGGSNSFLFDQSSLSCGGNFPSGSVTGDVIISCSGGSLAVGESQTVSIDATAPAQPGSYIVSAMVSVSLGGGLTRPSSGNTFISVVGAVSASPLQLDTATSEDTNANGQIDAFTLGFSDGSEGSVTIDETTLDTSDVTIDGYTVTAIQVAEGVSSNVLVTVSESGTPDTGNLPSSIVVSGISNTDGTEIEETTLTGDALVDGARPRMVSGEIAEDGLSFSVTFSEDLNGTTVNSSGGDFTLSTGTVTGESETSAGVVGVTLAEAFAGETLTVTVAAGELSDLNANPTLEHSIDLSPPTEEADTTPITISTVGLTTTATSTDAVMVGDNITLTFELGEVASTTTVSIEGNAISPSVDGTTYTAAYTVTESDTAGAVTFSITVADLAGNEATTTTTTDGSALTIVASEEGDEEESGDTVSFNISLYANDGGLNLISFPVAPADTNIASVLGDAGTSIEAVWAYENDTWSVYYPNNPELSNLTTMTSGYGYWIKVSADVTLSGTGTVIPQGASAPPSRTLDEDWNLVGYYQPNAATTDAVSMDTAFSSAGTAGVDYTALYGFNNQTKVFGTPTEINPGDAFWMFVVDANATLAPANL